MSDPYSRPSDPAKRRSAAITDGVDRAPARAMLKGIGFDDDALARPLVGIATTWIETMPCNWNQRELARHVRRGILEAGGTPMEFNTIAVSDGVSMGTEGMRASLVSREVIADSIELVVRGHLLDGLVCLVGCDKTIPAAVMALARLDVPGLVATSPSRTCARRSAPRPRGRCRPRTSTSSRAPRAPAPARAARSSPPTRWRWCSSSSASAPPGSTTCLRPIPRRRRPPTRPGASRCSSFATTCARRSSSRATRSRTPSPPSPPAAARRTASCICSRSPASSTSRSS